MGEYENAFAGFLKEHSKVYEGDEVQYRFSVFKSTMDTIFEHNNGNHTWTMGINQFSDLTPTEFEKIHLGYIHRENRERNYADLSGVEAANDIDWTTKGAVTAIKDQAQCGSCWAFSTTGSTESANWKSTSKLVSLSEQQLVDCSGSYGNQGCNGGLMDNAFKYYEGKGEGAILEAEYPYTARTGTCHSSGKTVAVKISTHTDVKEKSESDLNKAVTQQPVSIAVDAANGNLTTAVSSLDVVPLSNLTMVFLLLVTQLMLGKSRTLGELLGVKAVSFVSSLARMNVVFLTPLLTLPSKYIFKYIESSY